MDQINQLLSQLAENPNDMKVRQLLTDACAETGIDCPDLLGEECVATRFNVSGSRSRSHSGTKTLSGSSVLLGQILRSVKHSVSTSEECAEATSASGSARRSIPRSHSRSRTYSRSTSRSRSRIDSTQS